MNAGFFNFSSFSFSYSFSLSESPCLLMEEIDAKNQLRLAKAKKQVRDAAAAAAISSFYGTLHLVF